MTPELEFYFLCGLTGVGAVYVSFKLLLGLVGSTRRTKFDARRNERMRAKREQLNAIRTYLDGPY